MEKSRKCIKRFIKSCDAFGTFITFRINDDIEYKSIIGGLSTIFFVLVTLAYIIYCCIGFFGRSNVNLIYTSKVVDKSPFVNLTESQFSMAFGIQFSDPNKEKESNIHKEDDDNVEVNHHSSNKDDEFDVDENTKSVNKEEEDKKDEEPKNNYGELLKFKGAVDDIDDDLII